MSFLTSKTAVAILWALLIILLAWAAALYGMEDHATIWNYLFNIGYSLLYLFGALAALIAYFALGREGLIAKAFLYLGLSLAAYTGGQWIWAYYNLVGTEEVPYPSLADVLFILFIPFTAIALAKFLRMYQILVTKRVVIESILVFLASTALIFFFQGWDASEELSTLEKAFNLMYPFTDAGLITGAVIVIRSSGGVFHNTLILLVSGYLVGALADFTFSYSTTKGIYWNGGIADILFTISGFLMALAALKLAREFASLSAKTASH